MSDFDFACMCDSVSSPFREEKRVARKEHGCTDCSNKIKPGERYWYVTGRCEGEWWSGHVCARCESMYDWVKAHIPCLCVSFGNMHEELVEICKEASHQAPGLLFGLYRRMLGGKVKQTSDIERS